jgi:hypothetical protein
MVFYFTRIVPWLWVLKPGLSPGYRHSNQAIIRVLARGAFLFFVIKDIYIQHAQPVGKKFCPLSFFAFQIVPG